MKPATFPTEQVHPVPPAVQLKTIRKLDERANLVLHAGSISSTDPNSQFTRFVRDQATVLKEFRIHAADETAAAIRATGLFRDHQVISHGPAARGGIQRLIGMVVQRDAQAVVRLVDPADPFDDSAEDRALKRSCVVNNVRQAASYAAALQWASREARLTAAAGRGKPYEWRPANWVQGERNMIGGQPTPLPLERSTVALIAHDAKKLAMLQFAVEHARTLERYHRILATGTTGVMMQLVFTPDLAALAQDIEKDPKHARRVRATLDCVLKELEVLPIDPGLGHLAGLLRERLGARPSGRLASNVIPVPSGPAGGDVIVANEVLNNRAHAIVFFSDPGTAHGHDPDIRLLERTCQMPEVFAQCVGDPESALRWIKSLDQEDIIVDPSLAAALRERFGLHEAIVVDVKDERDSPVLAEQLAAPTAGYLYQSLGAALRRKPGEILVGVAWGKAVHTVLEQARTATWIDALPGDASRVVWSPAIGITAAETAEWEAAVLAQGFANKFGGSVEAFPCSGFTQRSRMHELPAEIQRLRERLENADIVLTSAAPWHDGASLILRTNLVPSSFPRPGAAVATIGGAFIDGDGREVVGPCSVVGLGVDGFRRVISRGGQVVLMCGGEARHDSVLAALRGRLASVLVTTAGTARAVLAAAEELEAE